jgi:ferredoxin-thioredoxin reductase catalytic chain
MNKTLEDVQNFAQAICKKNNWELNPDLDFQSVLLNGLQSNYNTSGYFLCPCRDGLDDRKKDKDITCPCEYALKDLQEYGHCFCALYMTPEFINSKKPFEQIPERRPDELWDQ